MHHSVQDEMIAFAVASEHVTYWHGRGKTYSAIAKSVGVTEHISRAVLVAKLSRIWLNMKAERLQDGRGQ